MAKVALVPMSVDRFVTWRAHSIAGYASENIRAGRWSDHDALANAEGQFTALLPDGFDTPGHTFWSVVDAAGNAAGDAAGEPPNDEVGILWVATEKPGHAFIYDIEMNPDRRGAGFGSATLLALEAWCRESGISSIGLHVFGHNGGAWQLYKRMGYIETDVQMEKRL